MDEKLSAIGSLVRRRIIFGIDPCLGKHDRAYLIGRVMLGDKRAAEILALSRCGDLIAKLCAMTTWRLHA